MLLLISLAFLEKVPREYFCQYEGTDTMQSCTPKEFCNNPNVVSFEPNMDLEDSYDNWVMRFDLHCASPDKIGAIAASFAFGWVLTLLIIPRLSDLHGRQNIMMVASIFDFVALTMILQTKSYTILICCMVSMGMMATARIQVAVNYMYESMERKHYTTYYTCIAVGEGISGLIATCYFMFVSKQSFWVLFMCFVMMGIAAVCIFLYPESPRYLIKTGQLNQAYEVFDSIAKSNGAKSVTRQEF